MSTIESDYIYDVFVSYRHDEYARDWIFKHFLPVFRFQLQNGLGYPPKIFCDKDIKAGESWPKRLKKALAYSRCLVGIWSPSYFHSAFCRIECSTMLRREQKYGFRKVEKPGGLIFPVVICDGQSFPSQLRKIQHVDFRKYMRIGKGFMRTERYVDFQDEVEKWVLDVAEMIFNAPEWDKAFLEDDGSEEFTIHAVQMDMPRL